MGVSLNSGTPKSSILIGFSIINHPFWGTPIFGNTHLALLCRKCMKSAIEDLGWMWMGCSWDVLKLFLYTLDVSLKARRILFSTPRDS